MKLEKEITVEVEESLEDLVYRLENHGFKLMETYDLNDIYMVNINDREEKDYLVLLNKCVLIRDIIEQDNETKMLTYKYKEYNDNKEITKQGKIKCHIDSINSAKMLLEKLNFETLIAIKDHSLVYSNGEDELVIQSVNDKHLYIEIESECNYIPTVYQSIDDMKAVIDKYSIPIREHDYFVKKAEIELKEVYGSAL